VSAVPGAAEETGKTAVATAPRRLAPTFTLAGIVAAIACAVPLSAAFLLVSARTAGLFFGYGAYADLVVVGSLLLAVAGLAAAVAIAIVAARSRSDTSGAVGQAPVYERSYRTGLLWIAIGVAACSAVVLVLIWGTGFGQSESDLILYAMQAAALVGLVAAAVLAVRAVWPGRPTSLRTRAFFVIAVAVLIPSFCLAMLGVWAYYRSWDAATSLYSGQASYQASELAAEIASVQKQADRFTPSQRARLAAAIAAAYGEQGHFEGAQLATLSQLRATSTLPQWALRSLARRGYAIGGQHVEPGSHVADTVAWRVGPHTVRYYVPQWTGASSFSAPTPVDRLFWIAVLGTALIAAVGLLGAWLLTRGVVRPVWRLAEASGRLAEGEAGIIVKPQGPRELRELATSFNDMNAKLTKAQETEQAFLLSVSHELKTPLTSIRGYAEGIGDGTVTPDDGAEVIGAESSRLERLVGDLLESGRMRKSAFAVRRETVDLAALAQDVARRYEGTARDAGLTLHLKTEAGGSALADNDRVLQVVSNLVENAVRCTPPPGTVTITTAPGLVTVSDTGRGLTSDDLPRAFERFYLYSRYGTDRPVGTGLGLAIVKDLTEAMGGTVSVSSAVGVGTAFTVALPQGAAPPSAPPLRDDSSTTISLPPEDVS
jgi:signal transduction histidine kinase